MTAEKDHSPLTALCAALDAAIGPNHDAPTLAEKAAHEGRAAVDRGFVREAECRLAVEKVR